MAEFLSAADQVDLLRKWLGNVATGDVSDTELAQYLWLAECDLAEMYEFAELRSTEDITTVAGTAEYELTEGDILRFLTPAQNITGNFYMKCMDADWDRKVGSLLSGQGEPSFWFESGVGANTRKQITLRPTPSGVSTIRIPFILVPDMPDPSTPTRSQIPVSHTLQVISRATEIGLQAQGERGEADAQSKLGQRTTYAARHALPKAAFYTNRLMTFQQRMNLNRRGRV